MSIKGTVMLMALREARQRRRARSRDPDVHEWLPIVAHEFGIRSAWNDPQIELLMKRQNNFRYLILVKLVVRVGGTAVTVDLDLDEARFPLQIDAHIPMTIPPPRPL